MQNTGCVINGGTHTHVYSNFADQQVQIDALTAKVEELKLLVQELLQRKDSEPAPEPDSEPESESEAEDIDVQDPDQPLTPEQEQLLLELKDISVRGARTTQAEWRPEEGVFNTEQAKVPCPPQVVWTSAETNKSWNYKWTHFAASNSLTIFLTLSPDFMSLARGSQV